MIVIGKGEQQEINRLQDDADQEDDPNGTGRQAGEEQCRDRNNSAKDHLPAHGEVFFPRLFEEKIPKSMDRRRGEEKRYSEDRHGGVQLLVSSR